MSEASDVILAGFALMLVFEGILPFVSPRLWRDTFKRFIEFSDGQLRFAGLASMLIGLLALTIIL